MKKEVAADYMNDFASEGEESESSKKSDFAALLESSFKKGKRKLSAGDKIEAEILVLGKEQVFVSTGTQNDGVVQRRDLLDAEGNCPYKTGDKVILYVTLVRGTEIALSPNPTAKNLADDLEDAFDKMLPVEGRVAEVCKGGVRVSVHGKMAFCPISQLDSKFVENAEEYVGKKLEFRITKFEEGGRNIIVSRKQIMEEDRALNAGTFLDDHHEGDVVKGRVTRLEKFGAFIELAPGVDGLAHISELSWSRVGDPAEVVQVGQEVNVKILKLDRAGNRPKISVSVKQAGTQPWDDFPAELQAGYVVTGKVTRCMNFGAFVEIAPGIEGLVPMSELSTARVKHPSDVVKEGEKVQVRIKQIDSSMKRISLSIKDAVEGGSSKGSGSMVDTGESNWREYAQTKSASGGAFGSALGSQLQAALAKKPGGAKK